MFKVIVDPFGAIKFIYSDKLKDLLTEGSSTIFRASHVEPIGTDWQADLSPVGGPVLGPFKLREEALAAEVEWLENNTDKWQLAKK